MKKVLMIALIASSIVACKNKNDEPTPTTAGKVSQVSMKDSLGNIRGGSKYYYNSNNQVIKSVELDTLGVENPNQITQITYNADGNINSINTNNSESQNNTYFTYSNGLVTKEIHSYVYSGMPSGIVTQFLDTTYYFYSTDKTLKYYISQGDSVVYGNYYNAKPQTCSTYTNGNLNSINYYSYDGNGNIIKTERQYNGGEKYIESENTYSNVKFDKIDDTNPSPRAKFERSTYIPLTEKYYNNNNNLSVLIYSYEISDFKYDSNGNLISLTENMNYYDYSTGKLTSKKKFTINFSY